MLSYVLLTAALFSVQRQLIYMPTQTIPDPAVYGLGELEVHRIKSTGGAKLLAWWSPPPSNTSPVIVSFAGQGGHLGNTTELARVFIDAGMGYLAVSWRYISKAGGEPSEEGLLADGRAALDFLASKGVAMDRVVVYGRSLGTGVAVAMAAERDVGGLVLVSPYTSVADIAQHRFRYIPAGWLVLDKFDSVARIGKVRAPILLIHGEKDTVIPVQFGRRLYEAAPNPKRGVFLPAGNHGNLNRLGLGKMVVEFTRQRFAG